ncbi:hypothetical protein [Argonema antarcticum]|uniref:hypothetical protein n=1 Tax=Argonema antarcticum TaxID=2942763 RepID=UPI0020139F0F|nr:hypothetical protein [Argonema antarcticum]MCL1469127.1 hypothetical protein [Argonema antarcticum A004/B2]
MTDKKNADLTPEESQTPKSSESGQEAPNQEAKLDAENKAEEPDAAKKPAGVNAKKESQDFFEKIHQKSPRQDSHQPSSKNDGDEQKEDYSDILTEDPELLQTKLKRYENDHKQKHNEYNILTENIGILIDSIHDDRRSGLQKDKDSKQRAEFEQQKESINKDIEKLENNIHLIKDKLAKVETLKSKIPGYKGEVTELTKEDENISANSLFVENKPIKNTVLYVATFFPDLNPHDFDRVVSFLLEEQTTTVMVKSQITTEHGEIRLIEAPKEKPLTEIWQESQHDQVLDNCYLNSVYLEDLSQIQIIDFNFLSLRDKLKKYFKKKLSLYLSKQFNRSRFLIFSLSIKVAINAIYLSVDMAISSPSAYGEDWLFEIIVGFTEKANYNIDNDSESEPEPQLNRLLAEITPEKRSSFVFNRVSSLIVEMLDYSQLQDVVKNFFEKLMLVKRYDAVLGIVKRLRSAPQFDELYWIKQLLDRGDEKIRSDAYKFLYSQLEQNSSCIYELLDTIKAWLPERDRTPKTYSQSNQYALRLLVEYCSETIRDLDFKDYGCWPSKYPLFAPLHGSSIESKLETLVTWIFHPGLNYILKYIFDTNTTQFIGFLVAEWFTILWGLEKKEPEQEASEVADNLIRQIILNTNRSQQKELVEFWTTLTDNLLDETEFYGESEDKKLRKESLRRRNLVKQLKKQFKAFQKNIPVAK